RTGHELAERTGHCNGLLETKFGCSTANAVDPAVLDAHAIRARRTNDRRIELVCHQELPRRPPAISRAVAKITSRSAPSAVDNLCNTSRVGLRLPRSMPLTYVRSRLARSANASWLNRTSPLCCRTACPKCFARFTVEIVSTTVTYNPRTDSHVGVDC